MLGFLKQKAQFLFAAEVPDLEDYIGRTVVIDGKKIKIKTIVGNKGISNPKLIYFYEINGEHLINALRFHAQMLGDKSITEEEFLAFENIEYEVKKPSAIDYPKEMRVANVDVKSKTITLSSEPSPLPEVTQRDDIWNGEAGDTHIWDENGYRVESKEKENGKGNETKNEIN